MADNWATPPELFDKYNRKFKFTLDPCADHTNHLVAAYYCDPALAGLTEHEWLRYPGCLGYDGLAHTWAGHRVFVNPPYARGQLAKWLAKANVESADALVACLIPVDHSTVWWQKYVDGKAKAIEYLKDRVKFINPVTGKALGSPYFDSCLAFYW